MAQQPSNPKLWQMLVTQAKARFATYPSPGASHWVHDQYVKSGGKFYDPAEVNRQREAFQRYREAVASKKEKQDSDHKDQGKRKNAK